MGAQIKPIVPTSAHDPVTAKETKGTWKVVTGLGAVALAVGIAVLAALGGVGVSAISRCNNDFPK